MAQSDARPTGDQFAGSIPIGSGSFVDIDHEIFSIVILSFPMVLEGQLSVSCQRKCSNTS